MDGKGRVSCVCVCVCERWCVGDQEVIDNRGGGMGF